jgi:hypothetical protein
LSHFYDATASNNTVSNLLYSPVQKRGVADLPLSWEESTTEIFSHERTTVGLPLVKIYFIIYIHEAKPSVCYSCCQAELMLR